jgi:3-phosphoshikimate 1-carboxyvinyltransferase
MSMGIAALASRDGIAVDDIAPINTSFPTFMGLLTEATA